MSGAALEIAYLAEFDRFGEAVRPLEDRYWRREATGEERAEIVARIGALLEEHGKALHRIIAESGAPRKMRRRLNAAVTKRLFDLQTKLKRRGTWEKSNPFAFEENADAFLAGELEDILEATA
ncbi:acyl-CoA reductase-like NAD-dependent aldehyde dehydrogenase [Azospirillum sp. OGB3]|uniref:hypothetical protein n=1 Tax=Azospirillum sp. OGB3 TaxID=2587012 RepID=UPI0016064250|nr:hypothetical protein [Azospirillum sp. OGB3]MBB3264061.1 acyl-CoA reductase-like NAD-dependent aldehyde dehydrogenase [Azospirillum sp. OGB3]